MFTGSTKSSGSFKTFTTSCRGNLTFVETSSKITLSISPHRRSRVPEVSSFRPIPRRQHTGVTLQSLPETHPTRRPDTGPRRKVGPVSATPEVKEVEILPPEPGPSNDSSDGPSFKLLFESNDSKLSCREVPSDPRREGQIRTSIVANGKHTHTGNKLFFYKTQQKKNS